jgi:hypothetical protein
MNRWRYVDWRWYATGLTVILLLGGCHQFSLAQRQARFEAEKKALQWDLYAARNHAVIVEHLYLEHVRGPHVRGPLGITWNSVLYPEVTYDMPRADWRDHVDGFYAAAIRAIGKNMDDEDAVPAAPLSYLNNIWYLLKELR